MMRAETITIKIADKIICEATDFILNTGEVWGILGPNGCGKTSMLLTLAGLKPLLGGKIYIKNKLLDQLKARCIAKSIGILFQDFTPVFKQTLWEYCLAARFAHHAYFKQANEQDKQLVKHALSQLNLLENKYKYISQLSGGEKRRLNIAALITQNPSLYLLDEPTNHLDIYYQIHILKLFCGLAKSQSATVVMSLHDINLAYQFCDHFIFIFNNGKVLVGKKINVFTEKILSQLYQHPIQSIRHAGGIFWQPQAYV